ncbi:hypothetical protein HHK36_001447 [Tetracentron sinense]|uniref:Disease resistance protein At4g27190-like leucine-rich repeats domain-containing protein n=1 Tax=Tetracentron sinense TaxID=13715 RepID=A0A834ZX94_TETSI|nr:hypothetical protein HHK36_001447 [Tetracentron sinense]
MITDKVLKSGSFKLPEESLALFCGNAGEVADRESIKPLAEAITRECSGLPLAIITVGRAMRGKAMVELWKDALSALQRSVPNIKGIEKEVFRPLKWSYDLLEGLLDEHQNLDESFNRGMTLIENLIASCLLEQGASEGYVRMHDMTLFVMLPYGLHLHNKERKKRDRREDLGFLQHLLAIYVRLDNIPNLPSGYSSLLQRLLRFHIVVSIPRDTIHYTHNLPGKHNVRRIIVCMNVSEERLGFLSSGSDLVLDQCTGMSRMCENLARITYVCFTGLKSLTIARCDSLGPMRRNARHDVLPNPEELTLCNLQFLRSISELIGQLGLRFSRLGFIEVCNCPRLTYLIHGNLSQKLEKLEEIKLSNCDSLSYLFHYSIMHNAIPNLRILKLEYLRSFCRWQMSWPRLEQIKVRNCPLLRKLPLSTQSANTLREIRGEFEWWNLLEWDDNQTKSSLQQYFQPIPYGAADDKYGRRISYSTTSFGREISFLIVVNIF